jgi:hypothetical protein
MKLGWHFNSRVELGYDVMKGTGCFVSLQAGVVVTEENNVLVNSDKLIGTAENLTL